MASHGRLTEQGGEQALAVPMQLGAHSTGEDRLGRVAQEQGASVHPNTAIPMHERHTDEIALGDDSLDTVGQSEGQRLKVHTLSRISGPR